MWETWVQSLGWEDPLKKEKATHSSILAWRIPWIHFAILSWRIPWITKSRTPPGDFHFSAICFAHGSEYMLILLSHFVFCSTPRLTWCWINVCFCDILGYLTWVCVLSRFSHVRLFATLWAVACQVLLSMGFPSLEYWSRLPIPSPGNLPNLGSNPCLLRLLHWQVGSLPLGPLGMNLGQIPSCVQHVSTEYLLPSRHW